MNDKKLTVFQRLGRVLGGEATSPTYIIDPKSFENLNQDDLEQKKLEAHQTFYLQNQWKKIDNELYQKAVYYELWLMAQLHASHNDASCLNWSCTEHNFVKSH